MDSELVKGAKEEAQSLVDEAVKKGRTDYREKHLAEKNSKSALECKEKIQLHRESRIPLYKHQEDTFAQRYKGKLVTEPKELYEKMVQDDETKWMDVTLRKKEIVASKYKEFFEQKKANELETWSKDTEEKRKKHEADYKEHAEKNKMDAVALLDLREEECGLWHEEMKTSVRTGVWSSGVPFHFTGAMSHMNDIVEECGLVPPRTSKSFEEFRQEMHALQIEVGMDLPGAGEKDKGAIDAPLEGGSGMQAGQSLEDLPGAGEKDKGSIDAPLEGGSGMQAAQSLEGVQGDKVDDSTQPDKPPPIKKSKLQEVVRTTTDAKTTVVVKKRGAPKGAAGNNAIAKVARVEGAALGGAALEDAAEKGVDGEGPIAKTAAGKADIERWNEENAARKRAAAVALHDAEEFFSKKHKTVDVNEDALVQTFEETVLVYSCRLALVRTLQICISRSDKIEERFNAMKLLMAQYIDGFFVGRDDVVKKFESSFAHSELSNDDDIPEWMFVVENFKEFEMPREVIDSSTTEEFMFVLIGQIFDVFKLSNKDIGKFVSTSYSLDQANFPEEGDMDKTTKFKHEMAEIILYDMNRKFSVPKTVEDVHKEAICLYTEYTAAMMQGTQMIKYVQV